MFDYCSVGPPGYERGLVVTHVTPTSAVVLWEGIRCIEPQNDAKFFYKYSPDFDPEETLTHIIASGFALTNLTSLIPRTTYHIALIQHGGLKIELPGPIATTTSPLNCELISFLIFDIRHILL